MREHGVLLYVHGNHKAVVATSTLTQLLNCGRVVVVVDRFI